MGQTITVNLSAETPGLDPDLVLNGAATISVTGPPGAPAVKVPAAVKLMDGAGWFNTRLPADGYWRIKAVGPGHTPGSATIGVGVNANTP